MIREEEFDIASPVAHLPGEAQCVLLVEDDPALRRYLEVVLQRAGYAVLTAGDGLEAMKVLLSAVVDVIVTDALMPNLDGYELCRFVRNSEHLSQLPIILLSALDPKNSTDESEQVDAFLSKPVSPEDLLSRIGEVRHKNAQKVQTEDRDLLGRL
jgi:CheY-like chemotaxis protein